MSLTQSDQSAANMRRAIIVLVCASVILLVGNGIRTSFGLLLVPMTTDLGWSRESFSLALAIQNIMWGVAQPVAGAYADKFGDRKVIAVSAGLYAAGLFLISLTSSPLDFVVNGGVLIGIAMSGTGIPIMLSVVGRSVPESRRSLFLGIAGSAGALGQATVVHGVQFLISSGGWGWALLAAAAASGLLVPLAAAFAGRQREPAAPRRDGSPAPGSPVAASFDEQSMGRAIRAAGRNDGFWYLNGGFFVCGFHVVFIQTHLPAYIGDAGLSPNLAAVSISVIAIGNILGSIIAGILGERYRKRTVLSGLYLGRSVIIAVFVLSPVSEAERNRVLLPDRARMALHGPPHHRARRPALRDPVPRDPLRSRVRRAPARELPRGLARGLRLRRDRELRHRVVGRGRARGRGRGAALADPRAAPAPSRGPPAGLSRGAPGGGARPSSPGPFHAGGGKTPLPPGEGFGVRAGRALAHRVGILRPPPLTPGPSPGGRGEKARSPTYPRAA